MIRIHYLCVLKLNSQFALVPFLLILFLLSLGIQLYFILNVFNKINQYEAPISDLVALPPVSVIVCSWNEIRNLEELLPVLDTQEYPKFEIIVVDDRSYDGTYDFLLTEAHNFKHLRFIRIEETPEHLSPKKYALTLGIKSAKYDVILLTDADCRPQSNTWIQSMASCLTKGKEIVLGFSPYFPEKTTLNKFIRYETLLTAVQYFGLALYGMPYMGVGRNLMYRKSLFFKNRGFAKHTNILGGDDDLFMNDVANEQNTTICLDEASFIYSIPKHSWQDWYRQKTRHISVSKHYKTNHKLTLGIIASSQILFWLSFIILIPLVVFSQLVYCILGFWLLRLIVQWVVLGKINTRLDRTISSYSIPYWDFLMTVYYVVMGVVNTLPKRKKMRWR